MRRRTYWCWAVAVALTLIPALIILEMWAGDRYGTQSAQAQAVSTAIGWLLMQEGPLAPIAAAVGPYVALAAFVVIVFGVLFFPIYLLLRVLLR